MPTVALALPPPTPTAIAATANAAAEPTGDATQGSPFATVLQEQLAAQILTPVPTFVELPAVDSAAEAPVDTLLPLLLGMAAQAIASDAGLQAPADSAVEAPADILLSLTGLTAQSANPDAGLQAPADSAVETPASIPLSLPGITAQSANSSIAANSAETGTLQLPATDPSTVIPLALPAIGIQPGDTGQKVGALQGDVLRGAADTPQARPAATSAANATAILAATGDAGGRSAFAVAKVEEISAAVAENTAPPRADAMPQVQTAQARAAEHTVRIEAPLGTRQWDGEFANRLAWMVGKNEQRADLVLTPPQLGRIEVSLSVNGEQATAIFTSASATVRDAIENALPRLREVLQESGINLGQAQVGSESPRQSPPRDENRDNRGNAVATDAHAMPPGFVTNSPTAWLRSGRGIIDVFA